MQREQILEHALNVLEQSGLAATTSLQQVAGESGLGRDQLELILEGCLSKLLVKRNVQDVATARRLAEAEDMLSIALCRQNGALA